MPQPARRLRVAIIYHYWAHYREPVARLLCQQASPMPEYVLVSGTSTESPAGPGAIATIDPKKASLPVPEGGLRWQFVTNHWLGRALLWQSGVLRLSLSRQFDAIIFLGSVYFVTTWLGALLARLVGKKVLMWSHGFLKEERGAKAYLRRSFYQLSDCMLLYGHRAKRIMEGFGFPPDRLRVIYNSLDYEAQRAVRESASMDSIRAARRDAFPFPTHPVLFFIGRLTHQKRLNLLMEAAGRLRARGQLVNLLFIGGGPAESELKRSANQSGLSECVRFHGPCYDEAEIGRLIMMADICVSPGEVGLTAIHAMAYGKPVITHGNFGFQMPEYEAVVPGVTGDFFTNGDSDSLAEAIWRWTRDDKYARASEACIAMVETRYRPSVQVSLINAAVLETVTSSSAT